MVYIKVRPDTALFLGLSGTRCSIPSDGGYIVYDRDLAALRNDEPWEEFIPKVGGVVLDARTLRAEQLGEAEPTPMPEITLDCILEFTERQKSRRAKKTARPKTEQSPDAVPEESDPKTKPESESEPESEPDTSIITNS